MATNKEVPSIKRAVKMLRTKKYTEDEME